MPSQRLRWILRLLITACGVALGIALCFLADNTLRVYAPSAVTPVLLAIYVGFCLLAGGVALAFSDRLASVLIRFREELEARLDKVPRADLLGAVLGLLAGLLIAALLSGLLSSFYSGAFMIAPSAILYVLLGWTGWRTGRRMGAEFKTELEGGRVHLHSIMRRKAEKKAPKEKALRTEGVCLMDASAAVDGRLAEIARLGFVRGTLTVPACVSAELERLAASEDAQKRARGRRGLETLRALELLPGLTVKTGIGDAAAEPQTALLSLARSMDAPIYTCDASLCRAASAAGLHTMNLNELAFAMKTTLSAGDAVRLLIVKAGREPGQGVGYLEDGTMAVVDGAGSLKGQEADCVVTSVLTTNAGRMVFAALKKTGESAC